MTSNKAMAAALAAVVSLLSPFASHAADGFIKGTVEFVRVHDRTWGGGAWSPPVFWFTLNGVASAGGCPFWTGRPAFVSDTRESFLTVLAAQMTGKEIAVYYNDTLQALGYCKAGYITVGDPPPLF